MGRRVLPAALPCLLLLAQELPFFQTRWVEDESWYTIAGATLSNEGRIRNPTFAGIDPESVVDARPPAMAMTLGTAFRSIGVGIVQARIPELVAALLTVIATFLLASELASPLAGFLAALLLAADNFFFLASRTVRPEVFVALFSTMAILLFLLGRRKQIGWAAFLSGLSAGIAVLFHVTALPVVACIALWIALEGGSNWYLWPRFWTYAAGVLLMTMPFVAWLSVDSAHRSSAAALYGRGAALTAVEKIHAESTRFEDYVGIGSQRFVLPWHVPYRAHIAGAVILGMFLLFRWHRRLFIGVMSLLLLNLVWWTYLVNKSSRYFAVIAPLLSIAMGVAAWYSAGRHRRLVAIVLVVLAGSQVAGNLFYLARAAQADYNKLAMDLRRIIPEGQPVYGAITFWMALRDRPFSAFERTPLDYALNHLGSFYLIANDRVMKQGSGYGNDDYSKLRSQVESLIRLNDRVELAGRLRDPFYGDLLIYHVRSQPAPETIRVVLPNRSLE